MLTDAEIRALGDDGVFVRDHFLGQELAAMMALTVEEFCRHNVRPAGMGPTAHLDRTQRGDEIAWVNDVPEFAPLVARFQSLRHDLNESAYLGLDRIDIQVARYPGDGAAYTRHRDALQGDPRGRRVTTIYYTNRSYEPAHGGVLRLHLSEITRDIEPLLDRLVVFLSERVWHEVLPTFAPRHAVTAWFYAR